MRGDCVDVGAERSVVLCDNRVVRFNNTVVLNTAARITGDVACDRRVNHGDHAAVFVEDAAADSAVFGYDVANNRRVDQVEPTVVHARVVVFAAGVVHAAARFNRAVAGDNRVADRQPPVVVVDAAPVVHLARRLAGRRNAVGNNKPVHFERRVVDVDCAEFLLRIDRYAGLAVFGVPCGRRVENKSFRRPRLPDDPARIVKRQRFGQAERRSGKRLVKAKRVPKIARTVFEATSAINKRFLPVQNVVDPRREGEVGYVHSHVVDIEILVRFVQRQSVLA